MQGSRDPLFLQLYFHTCTLRVFGKHTRPIQSGFEPIKKLVQVQVNELRESVSAKKKKKGWVGRQGKGAYQSPLQDPQKWKLCALD